MIDINDNFSTIIMSDDKYPNIDLDIMKKIGIVADHFGLLVHVVHQNDYYVATKKFDRFRRKEKV